MTDENYEARAQAHLASIKRDMKASMEDAAVRAMHKVMAEFEAKSDQRLMEMPEKFAGFDVVVDASLPPGTMKFEQPAPKIEANRPEPLTGGDERRHIICLCPDCTKPAQQQGPVAWAFLNGQYAHIVWGKQRPDDEIHTIPLYTSPPASKPWVGLTEQEAAECWSTSTVRTWQAIEAKLREKNT